MFYRGSASVKSICRYIFFQYLPDLTIVIQLLHQASGSLRCVFNNWQKSAELVTMSRCIYSVYSLCWLLWVLDVCKRCSLTGWQWYETLFHVTSLLSQPAYSKIRQYLTVSIVCEHSNKNCIFWFLCLKDNYQHWTNFLGHICPKLKILIFLLKKEDLVIIQLHQLRRMQLTPWDKCCILTF